MTLRASRTAEVCLGQLAFSVKLYAVASKSSVTFTQVHAQCGGRLEQQYFCAADAAVVPRPSIAKQYRHEDGTVTKLTEEELKTAEWDDIGTLEILECVPEGSVDAVYLGKAMLLGPGDEASRDAYGTFVDALLETRTAAIGLHRAPTRDQLVLLQLYRDRGLLLHELFYEEEMSALEEVSLPPSTRASLKPAEFALWTGALEKCRKGAFDAGAYADGYPERVRLAAERKASGGRPELGASRAGDLRKAARARVVKALEVTPSDRREPASVRALRVHAEAGKPVSEEIETTS